MQVVNISNANVSCAKNNTTEPSFGRLLNNEKVKLLSNLPEKKMDEFNQMFMGICSSKLPVRLKERTDWAQDFACKMAERFVPSRTPTTLHPHHRPHVRSRFKTNA